MTETQARKSAEFILGEDLYHALESTSHPLPQILNQCAMKCFLNPPTRIPAITHASCVRQALRNLDEFAEFRFDPE